MPKHANPPSRRLWADRFARPTAERLLGALGEDTAPLAACLRDALRGQGLHETVRWCGLPWRWALVFSTREGNDTAFLVPNPERAGVVFRISHEQFAELPTRKLSRYIRDGLGQAKLVAGVSWPEWGFQSQSQVKELLDLFGLLSDPALTGA